MIKFNLNNINWDKTLKIGSLGKVYPYQENPSDRKWITKIVNTQDPQELLKYFQVITFGLTCDNLHILPVRGYFIGHDQERNEWKIYMKLPRMKTSLRALLNEYKQRNKIIPEKMIVHYFYELIQGLQYLHEKGIAHKNLDPENIMIAENDLIKIAYFEKENLEESGEKTTENGETLRYKAPEIQYPDIKLNDKDLLKTDLWSLGMILFELCTRLDLKEFDSSLEAKIEAGLTDKLRKLEKTYDETLISLILCLLRCDPTERKGLQGVLDELLARYGDSLQLNDDVKEVKNEDVSEKTKIEELQKEMDAREIYIMNAERRYQEIIMQYETKISQLQGKIETPKMPTINDKASQNSVSKPQEKIEIPKERAKITKMPQNPSLSAEEERKRDELEQLRLTTARATRKFENARKDLFSKYGVAWTFQTKDKTWASLGALDTKKIKKDLTKNYFQDFLEYFEDENSRVLHLDILLNRWEPLDWFSDGFNQTVREIGLVLESRLTNLTALRFDMGFDIRKDADSGNLTDETLEGLCTQIGTSLQNLQSLHFEMSHHKRITDNGIKALSTKMIGALPKLTTLVLRIQRCEKITDQSLNDIVLQISYNLPEVTNLDLDFSLCNNITDQGLKELAHQLGSNLQNPQKLALRFAGCQKITDQGLEDLAFQFGANLQTLQTLELNFSGCKQVTDKGVKELASQIRQNLKVLNDVKFYCGLLGDHYLKASTQVTEQGKHFVIDCLARVPSAEVRTDRSFLPERIWLLQNLPVYRWGVTS